MSPSLVSSILDSEIDPTNTLSPYGCYTLYWFHLFFTCAVGILVFLYSLVWFVPRPVSTIDKSPISTIVLSITILSPPIFLIVTTYIILFSNLPMTCSFENHRTMWFSFVLVAIVEAYALAIVALRTGQILYGALIKRTGQDSHRRRTNIPHGRPQHRRAMGERTLAPWMLIGHWSMACVNLLCVRHHLPFLSSCFLVVSTDLAPSSSSTSGTFSSDPRANLDNGRWLTMESRRIKTEQHKQ